MSNQEHERYLEQVEEFKLDLAYLEADEAAEEEAYQIERAAELEKALKNSEPDQPNACNKLPLIDLLAVAKQTLGIK
jgi:hypothetical protein